jgi:hypothetical protein
MDSITLHYYEGVIKETAMVDNSYRSDPAYRAAMSAAGKKGGLARSERKTAAVRKNALKGTAIRWGKPLPPEVS